MEILNSGSFVPLDNREKIDQLIYTARELATEVSRAEGFQSSGQTNHQLGLEMWKGAEYVCRAHEEMNIRNLFLSKFLERLREIEKQTVVQTKMPQASTVIPEPVRQPVSLPDPVESLPPQAVTSQPQHEPPQDEYLGVVPSDDQTGNDRPSYLDECVPEFEAEIAAMNNGAGPADLINPPTEDSNQDEPQISTHSGDLRAEEVAEAAKSGEMESDSPVTKEQGSSDEIVEEKVEPGEKNSAESGSIESIILAEKEPYNLEACTVTAVIQVLPENSGTRKCVVSLRTHDFAPMFAVSEAGAGEIIPHISAALSDALAQYRIDLPAKAAEKLKKEKPAARKQSKSGSKSAKATTVQTKAATNSDTTAAAPAPSPETDQSQQGLFTS
jgi:hypothetical protein